MDRFVAATPGVNYVGAQKPSYDREGTGQRSDGSLDESKNSIVFHTYHSSKMVVREWQ